MQPPWLLSPTNLMVDRLSSHSADKPFYCDHCDHARTTDAVSNGNAILEQWRLEANHTAEAAQMTQAQAIQAMMKNGLDLQTLPQQLRRDREVVLTAVVQNGMALCYAKKWSTDREVVLSAVNQNGFALFFASDALKTDRKLVLKAVKLSGLALRWVSDDLKADEDVVMAAVTQCGMALEYAALKMQQSKYHVVAAVTQVIREHSVL